jgi:geranylgeranyl pyrophosphate synthase
MHRRYGVPIALNAGDLLIGEGYRLIAECDLNATDQVRMLRVAANSHRELCLGQGEELSWTHDPGPLSVDDVLDIFRRKTAPAFEVALALGAICAGADDDVCAVLAATSRALGIAYQIRDDLEDFDTEDLAAMKPCLLVALALEQADAATQKSLETELHDGRWNGGKKTIRRIVENHRLKELAWKMYGNYRDQALAALRPLQHQSLKSLLFRIIHKVLVEPPETSKSSAPRPARNETKPVSVRVSTGEGNRDAAL